jgi:hypothetical protein
VGIFDPPIKRFQIQLFRNPRRQNAAPCSNFKTNREPRWPKLPTLALIENYRTTRHSVQVIYLTRFARAGRKSASVDRPAALPNMPAASKWQAQFAHATRGGQDILRRENLVKNACRRI